MRPKVGLQWQNSRSTAGASKEALVLGSEGCSGPLQRAVASVNSTGATRDAPGCSRAQRFASSGFHKHRWSFQRSALGGFHGHRWSFQNRHWVWELQRPAAACSGLHWQLLARKLPGAPLEIPVALPRAPLGFPEAPLLLGAAVACCSARSADLQRFQVHLWSFQGLQQPAAARGCSGWAIANKIAFNGV